MSRYASLGKRDRNEPEIFQALKVAGCEPLRLTDVDIAAKHIQGHGVLLECKVPGEELSLTPIQRKLAELFKGQYVVVSDPLSALRACGRVV